MSLHNLQLLFFRFSISLLLASLLVIPHVRADCYTFNGTLNPDPDYQPCDSIEGSTSMCCATNRTTDGNVDVCLPNGLCQNFGLDSEGNKIPDTNGGYWRETCSDQSWKSPYCLKLCISSGDYDASSGYFDAQIADCGNSGGGLSTGSKVGIGVGVGVGVVALSALSAAWWFFRRKRGINGREKDKGAGFENDKTNKFLAHEMSGSGMDHELPSESLRGELDGTHETPLAELGD
ncbi:hypothetical protein MMC12_006220 [Toensbergia leucococca]|nr:hypothetical protein [Toensbergia leucococca]